MFTDIHSTGDEQGNNSHVYCSIAKINFMLIHTSSLGIELMIVPIIFMENIAVDNNATPLIGLPHLQAIHGAGPLPAPQRDP